MGNLEDRVIRLEQTVTRLAKDRDRMEPPAVTPPVAAPTSVDRAAVEALIARWEGRIAGVDEMYDQIPCTDAGYAALRARKKALGEVISDARGLIGSPG